MSVTNIGAFDQRQLLPPMQAVDSVQGGSQFTWSTPAMPDTDSQSGADKVSFSQTGQFMSQLSQLQKNNPTLFSEVTSNISHDLCSQASSSGEPTTNHSLKALSQQFAQASQSGSTTSLAGPSQQPQCVSAETQASQIVGGLDTNKDGTVSLAESGLTAEAFAKVDGAGLGYLTPGAIANAISDGRSEVGPLTQAGLPSRAKATNQTSSCADVSTGAHMPLNVRTGLSAYQGQSTSLTANEVDLDAWQLTSNNQMPVASTASSQTTPFAVTV